MNEARHALNSIMSIISSDIGLERFHELKEKLLQRNIVMKIGKHAGNEVISFTEIGKNKIIKHEQVKPIIEELIRSIKVEYP